MKFLLIFFFSHFSNLLNLSLHFLKLVLFESDAFFRSTHNIAHFYFLINKSSIEFCLPLIRMKYSCSFSCYWTYLFFYNKLYIYEIIIEKIVFHLNKFSFSCYMSVTFHNDKNYLYSKYWISKYIRWREEIVLSNINLIY